MLFFFLLCVCVRVSNPWNLVTKHLGMVLLLQALLLKMSWTNQTYGKRSEAVILDLVNRNLSITNSKSNMRYLVTSGCLFLRVPFPVGFEGKPKGYPPFLVPPIQKDTPTSVEPSSPWIVYQPLKAGCAIPRVVCSAGTSEFPLDRA